LKDPAELMVLGNLFAPIKIEKFTIIKAEAWIDGILYDLMDKIIPRNDFIFETIKLSDKNRICPVKVLDFSA
jgi:hypothetical protein